MGSGCSKSRVSPHPGEVITGNPVSVEDALARYINAVVSLRSCDRDVTVAQWKVSQILCDSLYRHDCIPLRRVYIGRSTTHTLYTVGA